MSRVKRGITHVKRRRRLRKATKGYQWGRKNTLKLGKIAVLKAGVHAYRGRKQKKQVNRGRWLVTLNAALSQDNLSYSKFIGVLKKQHISLNRKILSDIAQHHPMIWKKILEKISV